MKIDSLILGSYETNCYILRASPDAKDCLLIDTGLEPKPLLDFLQAKKLKPAVVIFTHGHADHIAGAELLRSGYPDIKLAIHRLDAQMLTTPRQNLSLFAGVHIQTDPAEIIIEAEGPVEFAGIKLQILHTPGHTPGGISLYSHTERVVFTGDALFAGSIGRTDFPNASGQQLIASVKHKLLTLPEDTAVYPGHGPATTIGREKTENPFLQ